MKKLLFELSCKRIIKLYFSLHRRKDLASFPFCRHLRFDVHMYVAEFIIETKCLSDTQQEVV